MNELKHFAFAADDGYSMQVRVVVASLLNACCRTGGEIFVHILDIGITDDDWMNNYNVWKSIMPDAVIVRHCIDSNKYASYKFWHGSLATYARLDLPELLPEVDWCFYFDCDVLIANDPRLVEGLCDDRFAIIGHRIGGNILKSIEGPWLASQKIEYDSTRFVCAGVLLMNLKWFRDHSAVSKCYEFLNLHPDVITPDQTALNIVCQKYVGLLPSGWGSFSDESMKIPNCSCVHFPGMNPWSSRYDIGYFCGEHRLAEIWRDVAVKIAGVDRKRLDNLDLKHTWKPRVMAIAACIVLRLCLRLRICPSKYSKVFASFRDREIANVAIKLRMQIFRPVVQGGAI